MFAQIRASRSYWCAITGVRIAGLAFISMFVSFLVIANALGLAHVGSIMGLLALPIGIAGIVMSLAGQIGMVSQFGLITLFKHADVLATQRDIVLGIPKR